MYLNDIANAIRAHIPDEQMPSGRVDDLLRLYAILLRAKGSSVSESDIHDAWSAWMATHDSGHESLLPYDQLSEEVQDQDRVFAVAVRRAAGELNMREGSRLSFGEILFPFGPPKNDAKTQQAFDLYKIMVDSSESLVSRRQAVNTFFLTMNGALLTAFGIIVQVTGGEGVAGWGIFVLAIAGVVLCLAWRSLVISFGQLNAGKFKVINTIERYLKAAIYAAEWEALGRGENPKVYRSFTSREIWVPNSLVFLHLLAAVAAVAMALGCLDLDRRQPSSEDTTESRIHQSSPP